MARIDYAKIKKIEGKPLLKFTMPGRFHLTAEDAGQEKLYYGPDVKWCTEERHDETRERLRQTLIKFPWFERELSHTERLGI